MTGQRDNDADIDQLQIQIGTAASSPPCLRGHSRQRTFAAKSLFVIHIRGNSWLRPRDSSFARALWSSPPIRVPLFRGFPVAANGQNEVGAAQHRPKKSVTDEANDVARRDA